MFTEITNMVYYKLQDSSGLLVVGLSFLSVSTATA